MPDDNTNDKDLSGLFEQNARWAEKMEQRSPGFFTSLLTQQTPQYLWIGCADSRVPANELIGLLPGDVFVHRNVANVVAHSDLNALSVIQFAVDALKVRHVIVVGHSKCGGVTAALNNSRVGVVDNWLRHVQDVRNAHMEFLQAVPEAQCVDALLAIAGNGPCRSCTLGIARDRRGSPPFDRCPRYRRAHPQGVICRNDLPPGCLEFFRQPGRPLTNPCEKPAITNG